MNSNYVAEIQSTGIPDEQLVSGDMCLLTYMYPDTSSSSGIHVSGRHVSWCRRGIRVIVLFKMFRIHTAWQSNIDWCVIIPSLLGYSFFFRCIMQQKAINSLQKCNNQQNKIPDKSPKTVHKKWRWSLQYFSNYRVNSKVVTHGHTLYIQTDVRTEPLDRPGRLKMRDLKMRDGQKCRGGKCGTIKYGKLFGYYVCKRYLNAVPTWY